MKKKTLKRISAVIAACTVMAASMPVVASLPTSAAENLITNSDFSKGTTDWGTYKESGGVCKLTTKDGQLCLTVSNVGRVNYAVQVFYDIVPLYKNGVYRLKYDISSSVDRFVEGMIQQNGGTYQAYTWKGIQLTSEPQTIDYEFTMEQDSDIMAKLVFNCGIQEKYEGELPEHEIYLDNVSLELIDDSNVNYDEVLGYQAPINVNQVGYRTDSVKKAVIRGEGASDEFEVINADTKAVAYKGKLGDAITNTNADEINRIADFSDLKESGKYYVKCGTLDDSYTFEISDNVYEKLIDDSVRMLYLQRCGEEIIDKDFGHKACHTSMATVYGTNNKIDVNGGWHDAGDFGRYTVAAAKAVADLMYAYDANPEMFSDNIGIPESGNGIPDILDETKYELDWMLKMQADNGGVYHKVSCENFPGYIMPTEEKGALIVTPISSTATADFCASMAMASEFYKEYDKDFAAKCLNAAEKAWAFLEENPNFIFKNPEDITTGDYGDSTDKDERYWAAAQMYRATGDDKYSQALSSMKTSKGLDWSTVGDYGNIAIITMDNADKESAIYKNAVNAVISQADKHVTATDASAYGVAVSTFNWGSNMTVANAGIIMSLANKLTGDSKYAADAESQLDYLLGVNPLGKCFVTGFGTDAPQNPHHRPSMAVGSAMPGMLVGGVDQMLDDSAAKAYCRYSAPAKRYVDHSESYSTNEITIYWNSPLTYLLALTDDVTEDIPEETTTTTTTTTVVTTTETTTEIPDSEILFGDSNCDGTVNLSDAVMIMQALANPDKYGINGSDETHLSEQGKINADVTGNGDGMTNSDALTIQKYVLKLIDKLPE